MADTIYGIDARDEPLYRQVIQRERRLTQPDFAGGGTFPGVSAVMILETPAGFEPGKCAVLPADAEFPYCYEVSIIGYPGFGILNTIRGHIQGPNDLEPVEFSFARDATAAEIIAEFPVYWRDKMTVTGGQYPVGIETIPNPNYVDPVILTVNPETYIPPNNTRTIDVETTIATGRHFIGFKDLPVQIAFAETDVPTAAEIAALGFDAFGDPVAPGVDQYGFQTSIDPRASVRFREVTFLVSPVVHSCVSLVDTSIPSPIAVGALAFGAPVAALGFSLISIEPRVYQNLTGVFDVDIENISELPE